MKALLQRVTGASVSVEGEVVGSIGRGLVVLVGVAGGENNQKMTALFGACNAHPRMGKIYDQYLAAWTQAGGDVFCNFSSVGRWSKWGSWGVMQHYDEDPAKAYKFLSLMRWAKRCGQEVTVPK